MKGQPGNIQECRSETVETDGRRGFSQARATQAYPQRSVEETEREKPRRARGSADAVGIHEDSRAKGQMPMSRVPARLREMMAILIACRLATREGRL
jgi:hypothetical protein